MKLKFYYGLIKTNAPGYGMVAYKDSEVDPGVGKPNEIYMTTFDMLAPDIKRCENLMAATRLAQKGELPESENGYGMNDIVVYLYKDYVQINLEAFDDCIDEPEGRLTMKQWWTAITAWRRFLDMPISYDSVIYVDLPES